jgi:hypothetical protein
VRLEGQSSPILYYPKGSDDVLFEIKFDRTSGRTFDGHTERQAEIEIEIKKHPASMTMPRLEELLDRTENALISHFADSIQPIYESKVSGLFRHLAGWRARNPQEFSRVFKDLPGNRWTEWTPG